jgi:hypothetical protein
MQAHVLKNVSSPICINPRILKFMLAGTCTGCLIVLFYLSEAPRYKLEGGGFDSRRDHWIFFFSLRNHSSRTMALWSTHPLIEMSTGNLPGG